MDIVYLFDKIQGAPYGQTNQTSNKNCTLYITKQPYCCPSIHAAIGFTMSLTTKELQQIRRPQVKRLLLIENDLVDIMGFRHAIKKVGCEFELHVARNGSEALVLLFGSEERPPVPTPFVLLTDLRMPGMDGIELLEKLREHPTLKNTVAFVYTSSESDIDKENAYKHNIAGYLIKKEDPANLEKMVRFLCCYFENISLPS